MRDGSGDDEFFVLPDRGYTTQPFTTQPSTSIASPRARFAVDTAIAGQGTIGASIHAEVPNFPLLSSAGALAVDGTGPLGAQTMISWNSKTGGQAAATDYLLQVAESLGYLHPCPELILLASNLATGIGSLSARLRVKGRTTEDRNLLFAAGIGPQTVNLVIKVRDLLEIN